MSAAEAALPLLTETSDRWARAALAEPVALLNDHAHLEKKAALNALELLHRWPETAARRGDPHDDWVMALAAVAKDETAHLHTVARLLKKRGGRLSRGHKNGYAAGLHAHIRMGKGPDEVLDRLLASALIEARSCERFAALARNAEDAELAALYRGLYASEKGHYLLFLDLARSISPIDKRWPWFQAREAEVLKAQSPGPRMHSGEPA